MKKAIIGFLFFVSGGALGFAAANKLMMDKYEQLVQDEVDSVKAALRKVHPLPEKKEPKPTEGERRKYSQMIHNAGYTDKETPASVQPPRVISPDEFGGQEEYDQISLTYYSDGTVADDNDRPMDKDEIEETIGQDSLKHFGEYEDDSVFVRNDRLKADYEILLDERTYADILREKPYLAQ